MLPSLWETLLPSFTDDTGWHLCAKGLIVAIYKEAACTHCWWSLFYSRYGKDTSKKNEQYVWCRHPWIGEINLSLAKYANDDTAFFKGCQSIDFSSTAWERVLVHTSMFLTLRTQIHLMPAGKKNPEPQKFCFFRNYSICYGEANISLLTSESYY